MNSTEVSPAPYPADTRSKGWRFELDLEQIAQSDTWALCPAAVRPWLLMIWATAWAQMPCGSLPCDDRLLCARLGMPIQLFEENKDVLLRGWRRAADGLMYHDTITKVVLGRLNRKSKHWANKLTKAERSAIQAMRHAAKLSATPKWLTKADKAEIAALYADAALKTASAGTPYHVDHIVPLRSKVVCGLHVAWNLRVITASENRAKSNLFEVC